MRNLKIAIFSDIHIHPHSSSFDKLNNCLDCLEWIYSETKKRGIKYLIFIGDLFHDRRSINTYAYHKTYDILKKYKDDITSFYLLGNHDIYYKNKTTVNSVSPISEIVNVIDKPTTISIEDRDFDFLPYTEDPIESFSHLGMSDILFGHLSVPEAILNSKYNTKYRSDDIVQEIKETPKEYLDKYKKVFLGHFHYKQKISESIEYVGSPLQISFNEAMDKKGFIIFNADTYESEFIKNNKSPEYCILPLDNIEDYPLDNNYARIIIPEFSNINQIKLREELQNKYKCKSIELIPISSEKERESELKKVNNIDIIMENSSEIIEQYVNSVDSDLDKDLMIKCGLKIMNSDLEDITSINYEI